MNTVTGYRIESVFNLNDNSYKNDREWIATNIYISPLIGDIDLLSSNNINEYKIFDSYD